MTDLYGFASDDLELVKTLIEPVLGIKLDGHESSFRCGNYYLKELPGCRQFALQKNRDVVRGDWSYEDYKELGVLLFVSLERREQLEDVNARLTRVDGICHLERVSIDFHKKISVERIYKGKEK